MNWVSQYGTIGLFFALCLDMLGVPIPAETTLTVAGFAWKAGALRFWPAFAAGVAGHVVGCGLAYGIGRRLGRPLLHWIGPKIGLTAPRVARTELLMKRHALLAISVGKFISGVRVVLPYLFGLQKYPFLQYTLYNAAVSVIWCTVFLVEGRLLGGIWLSHHAVWGTVVLCIFVIWVLGWIYYRKRRSNA